jgi:diguanylate cyclase (GGDEF)-like protein
MGFRRERRETRMPGQTEPLVVIATFLIGTINFGLGFSLAVLLERPLHFPAPRLPRLPKWNFPKRKPRASAGPPPDERAATDSPAALSPPTTPQAGPEESPEIPPDWAELLKSKQVAFGAFAEALYWVAHFRLKEFGTRLSAFDLPATSESGEFPLAPLQAVCEDIRLQFSNWQTAIARYGRAGAQAELLIQFSHWLDEAAPALDQLAEEAVAGESDRHKLLQVFSDLSRMVARCDESLARSLSRDQQLSDLPATVQFEPGSRVLSRLGLEKVACDWIHNDPDRVRITSALLVDVDHCARLNEQHGLSVTNRLLDAAQNLVTQAVRKDRGFDCVARTSGQTFLVLLGDTAVRNAVLVAERTRLNLSAAGLEPHPMTPLTISCAVTEWESTESFAELVDRLRLGIVEAKAVGRNCSVVCGPDGTRVAHSTPSMALPSNPP